MMGHDPRLPKMPDKPTLFDFFKYRFGPANHLLQSARLARRTASSEKIVLACLLHDIAIAGFIRGDHGYWAAQLVEPYVDEEVSWAIRYHQALRFFPDESVGYKYPELLRQAVRRGLRARRLHPARLPVRARTTSGTCPARLITRERPLRVRPQRAGRAGGVHGHRRPPLQAAEGRPRLRREPVRAHVADDQLADEVPVGRAGAPMGPRSSGCGRRFCARTDDPVRAPRFLARAPRSSAARSMK